MDSIDCDGASMAGDGMHAGGLRQQTETGRASRRRATRPLCAGTASEESAATMKRYSAGPLPTVISQA